MRQQHQSLWRRWIALSSLFGLLLFSVASSAHIHNTANSSGVQQECKLCVTGGLSPILTAGTLLSGVLLFAFCLFPVPTLQPFSANRHQPGNPRSPPLHL